MKRLMLSATGCLLLGLMVQTTCTPTWLSAGEDERAREVKAQFARQAGRIKSLAVTYHLETKSNLAPEKLRALPEYQNQLFLPQDEWREAFKGEKRFRRQIQPERVKYLVPLDENGLAIPAEPSPDASPAMKENQKKLRGEYERAVATTKAMEARGIRIPRRDPALRDRSEQDVTRAYNGKTLWMKQPASRTSDRYLIWPTGSEANWFQISAYLSAVGLHVPDPSGGDFIKKAQAMFRLAEWIKDPSYELEPRTEIVDGSTCVILKGSLNSLLQPGLVVGQLTDRIVARPRPWIRAPEARDVPRRQGDEPVGKLQVEGSRAWPLAADELPARSVPVETDRRAQRQTGLDRRDHSADPRSESRGRRSIRHGAQARRLDRGSTWETLTSGRLGHGCIALRAEELSTARVSFPPLHSRPGLPRLTPQTPRVNL